MKIKLLNYLMHHPRKNILKKQLAELFTEDITTLLNELAYEYPLEIHDDFVIYYPDPPLSTQRLTADLNDSWPNLHVKWEPTLTSTNVVLKEKIQTGELTSEQPQLLIADTQTAGRGRLGRSFSSDSYNGLYMSLFIPFKRNQNEWPPFTLIAAAALTQALKSLTDFDIKIKWVNDLYLNRKKVAGILTETTINFETNQLNGVIIGTGVNLSAFPEQIPPDLRHKMGTLFEPGQELITREQLIVAYLTEFSFLLNDSTKRYYPIYCQHSLVLGNTITFQKDGKTITGQAVNILEDGQLLVTLHDLTTITLLAGEVSLQSY